MALNPLAEDYYDNVYRRMIDNPQRHGWSWLRNRTNAVAPHVVGDSVLDLGCGLSLIADQIEDRFYTGVDFSSVALDWCRDNVQNENALFVASGLVEWLLTDDQRYDTVVMMEELGINQMLQFLLHDF